MYTLSAVLLVQFSSMTNTLAIVDAKILSEDSQKAEILNIAIQHNRIIALGYTPDDEGVEYIDAKHHFIIPNCYNLYTSLSGAQHNDANTGLSVHIQASNQVMIIPELAYHLDALNDVPDEHALILSSGVASEALYIAQELKKTAIKNRIHFIVDSNDCETLPYVLTHSSDQLTFGLCVDTSQPVHQESIRALMGDEKLLSISTKDDTELLQLLYQLFPEDFYKVSTSFFKRSLKTLFPSEYQPLSLNKAASFSIIPTRKELFEKQGALLTVRSGKIIK